MAILSLLQATKTASYRTLSLELDTSTNWNFFTISFKTEERFLLFELIRMVNDESRSLLTAGFETTPIALMNETTGLWTISSQYWDVDVWSHHLSYGSMQIRNTKSSV